ncbi:2-hydroxychromene-2-carboxylate isomerase [Kineobactrum sediminis]|uniref:2-hydroxychromene-2-carboxylate isomerase n=1 Tax=Kineobactrum sediminis TaxID=1905677 RepID=A0A2N5Y6R0_9GAMM|nr:2-hydroxychromene-2-carboxylate isomerase [Kineobactrum sediminis]PLW84084.1 2-hydroxychromene-2-carboxylate isomerase [Kineobactrum sediminis]
MSITPKLEFFYDCSSPWTYLAFSRIVPLASRLQVPIIWRPILVGGVFNAVNRELYAAREKMFANPRRLAHYQKDLKDWADLCGLRINHPDVFPVNSAYAMRGALYAAEQGKLVAWSKAVFTAYWGDNRDISDPTVLAALATDLGLDATALVAATGDPAFKARLRENTDELVARGGYGSPTLFINDDDLYFGNDRLPVVEHRLQQLLANQGKTS